MTKFIKAAAICLIMTNALLAQAAELRVGTASLGGAFYPMGQTISNLVNKYGTQGSMMIPVVTGGSVQNPRLLGSGEVDIAITNNNLAALAIKGVGPYKSGPIEMSAIAALHPSVLHMVVMKGSDIKTIEDLKGKRVAVGPAGGGTLSFLNFLLSLHDMSLDDMTPSFLSYSDGFSQLSDGAIDAAFALSGYPAGAVMQAAASNDLAFITFSDGMLEKALEANSVYRGVLIPKEVYGTESAGLAIGVNNMLIVANSTSSEIVEDILHSVFDHLDEFSAQNANAKQIDPLMSLDLSIPLHPGAKRYFESR
ncbi:TAXI family TRAP transporter solute-binding subunit [Marinomonas colpomeniae]|uniref:TAXI family TRAP transporter solute-binding subunit n=1 Tax=Marinomonas colpomeniae TaxID=2774408 RepID=A0ABR8NTX1_9GAMM|nr:TAXI family TRAP transporter solute-binding subunit [Marinomonas colpomeniae]MBD5769504.1 TAXI family TRAP transporter solute-binding subunit [Marinomonas colpomeniae]